MSKSPSTPARHNSQKFYQETHHINGHTMIYRGTHSPNYYVRYNTLKGYVTKSLRTKHLDKAKARAEQLASVLLTQNIHGVRSRQTVASVSEWYCKQSRFKSVSNNRQKQIIRTMRIYSDFFKSKSLEDIRRSDWAEFWDFRASYYDDTDYEARTTNGKLLAKKTALSEKQTWRAVMRHASDEGIIHRPPPIADMPKEYIAKSTDKNRPDATFTQAQYEKYRIALNEWVDTRCKDWRSGEQGRYTAHMVKTVLWTIRHSGTRVLECLRLRHGDIEKRILKSSNGDKHETFAMFIEPTKNLSPHSRYAILNHSGYIQLQKFIEMKQQLGLPTEPGDYVFAVFRNTKNHYPANLLGTIFRKIVKEQGLYNIGDRTNPTRATVRLLRRYYILRQLDNGTSIEHVAMAVGHTPRTTERWYNSIQRERYESQVFSGSYFPNINAE